MEVFGKELLFGGVTVMALAQLGAAIIAFRVSFSDGMCSLVIPGYMLVSMRRSGYYWRFFALWVTGVLAIIVGTMALS
jgi:hypothetical protein